ncbi:heme/hemin ABC transporter substrate-binding protein [Corynebacterium cystitidis]|uniref:heme/hemin ABC transporter substrate-binding protein n=1 Tax=Corynebacterium cystitidis TaxID=35757 RepID=UPI00211ED22B|nr:ABC transporter substrate-binding protein [Corynebacterium cystitidis]
MILLQRFRRLMVAAVVVTCLHVTGCASWDSTPQSTTDQLASDLREQGTSTAPQQGLALVEELAEVEPIENQPKQQLPVELVDADGYNVSITDTSRILALDLYGTYTKTLRGLGFTDNIVGRTVSSTEASLSDVPVVTQGHTLNAEAVLNLQPTLVIVDHSIGPPEAIDQIREAGVTTVVMEPTRSLDTMEQDILDVAGVMGVPEVGEKLAQRSRDDVITAQETIAEIRPETPLKMAFLYARGTGGVFYLLGQETGTQDLIEALGGIDVATENGVGAPRPATPEALAEVNPEVFVMMSGGLESTGDLEGLLARPGVSQTIAGSNQRVLALPDGDSLAYGPQTGELLLRAAQELYQPGAADTADAGR